MCFPFDCWGLWEKAQGFSLCGNITLTSLLYLGYQKAGKPLSIFKQTNKQTNKQTLGL
jgi:hypothetical protein